MSDVGDQGWLLPLPGRTRTECVADVALRRRSHRVYTYSVPAALASAVAPGVAVRVPYGSSKRLVDGWCLRVSQQEWNQSRRPIAEVGAAVLLTPGVIDLALWVSDYYVCPPGKTIEAVVPAPLREAPRTRAVSFLRVTSDTTETAMTARRMAVLAALRDGPRRRADVLREAAVTSALVRAMAKDGLIESFEQRVEAPFRKTQSAADVTEAPIDSPEDRFALTTDQTAALEAIGACLTDPPDFRVFLLFGVPGSGKTEVYVRAIRQAVAGGRQAIVLVPEIALATQVVERFARRFSRVAVLHSRLRPRQRAEALRAIAAGEIDVVIGTRTAVFASCPRLGLIVVDEEQETSLKNIAAPHYHARDVAIKRGQIERIPVVLGSATPSLETWHNAHHLPHFKLLRLPQRVPGAALPQAAAIDTRQGPRAGGVLSVELRDAVRETLALGEQIILLHNRRGYSARLRCTACGLIAACARCGAHLVEHRADDQMKCHRCGTRQPRPTCCLDNTCRGPLERSGLAIQRLEEEVRGLAPAARILRLDRDTMKRREDYATALAAFERREADILLGTQMVAKGLDFPSVRLVGVLDVDSQIGLPDFRAAEAAFQLIVQVTGRAGRGQGGSRALIQTADPRNPVLQHALRMDYESFARDELSIRRELGYPPFGRLVRLVLLDEQADRARGAAAQLSESLRRLAGRIHAGIHVGDAQPCLIPRLRDLSRFEIVIRCPRDGSAQKLLHEAISEGLLSPGVTRLTVDVDPADLM
ncbi:MAG: primosomal protein N' [Planctomycetes bacterium]|nr:primosomal protein N' [Planctomycetota bacterium]